MVGLAYFGVTLDSNFYLTYSLLVIFFVSCGCTEVWKAFPVCTLAFLWNIFRRTDCCSRLLELN